jgi:hypothetical protein
MHFLFIRIAYLLIIPCIVGKFTKEARYSEPYPTLPLVGITIEIVRDPGSSNPTSYIHEEASGIGIGPSASAHRHRLGW